MGAGKRGGNVKLITVFTPCFNEEENVERLFEAVAAVFAGLQGYEFQHLFIDNCSTDATADVLRRMAAKDSRVKVILNMRNYGHARSPHHAMLQAQGAAVIGMCADFQDPPELIPRFLEHWEQGFKIVAAVKHTTEEKGFKRWGRRTYYRLLRLVSSTPLLDDFTGFGLYDRVVIEAFRRCRDEDVYFRGFIAELGYSIARIPYHQPLRRAGRSKNTFWSLLDTALSGVTAYGRGHLRIMTLVGMGLSAVSFLTACAYLLLKLTFWNRFELGWAPVLIGIFFFASIQLFMLGMLGEFLGVVVERLRYKPPLVERERINLPPIEDA